MKRLLSLILTLLIALLSTACTAPLEHQGGNYYEIFVRSFYDSDADGKGDLTGVRQKLNYLADDLGIDGIWLMPIMPSPSYHKYDVTDYTAIDPTYGTMADFDALTASAKKKGIKVLLDLVLNHTSDQHPWFLSAVRSLSIEPCGQPVCIYPEGCREHNPYVSFYNFTRTPDSKGYSSSNMPDGWYYEAVFSDHMPDLNLDNPALRQTLLSVTKFWIDHGVDGFRLDAVLHFYEGNAERNIAFLEWLKENTMKEKTDIYLVGEAWADAGTVQHYYDSQIDSLFNFSLSGPTGAFIETLRSGKGNHLIKSVSDYQKKIEAAAPSAVDAIFLSNHDQGRSAGFLIGDLVKEKLAANLYLLLPGNSFIYYGEEIGMFGSGKDENKRAPLLWSVSDTTGMTTPVEGTESIKPLAAGIKEQMKNRTSLWSHYRKILQLKRRYPAISRGDMTPLDLGDSPLFGYNLVYNGETLFVIHNFSAEQQSLDLDPAVYTCETIIGDLTATESRTLLEDKILTLPPYSSAVLK